MGILNVTPDSFSDGNKHYNNILSAFNHVKKMINDGADIIDIGGESTKKNCCKISQEEELDRIVPPLKKIVSEIDIPISIDTIKPSVAEIILKMFGKKISIINDFSGNINSEMASVCAKYKVNYLISRSYNKIQDNKNSGSFLENCLFTLKNDIEIALKNKVIPEQIIIDPALGFFNGFKENFEIINNLLLFKKLGYPILVGASRKSFLSDTLPDKDLVLLDVISAVIGGVLCSKGCNFIRVHDVKKTKAVLEIYKKMNFEG